MLLEEQWAQTTFRISYKDTVQYCVFERRLADKLSFYDWKLCFILDDEDFDFIHAKKISSLKAI